MFCIRLSVNVGLISKNDDLRSAIQSLLLAHKILISKNSGNINKSSSLQNMRFYNFLFLSNCSPCPNKNMRLYYDVRLYNKNETVCDNYIKKNVNKNFATKITSKFLCEGFNQSESNRFFDELPCKCIHMNEFLIQPHITIMIGCEN